jgi:ABC-type uncharacterized transport system involved in gliding motility auxiliary subunit
MLKGRKLFSTSGLVVAAVLLLVINLFSGLIFKGIKVDMTANKLYTLSDGTRNILRNIDEPITLRFYFSEKLFNDMPVVANYGQRVRELLEEYASLSDGKIKLIIENPEPFSDTEEQAVKFGMQGVPMDASGTNAYFGLAGTNAVDDLKVIPFFQPAKEDALEYDVSKLVYGLANPKRPVVGLLAGLPLVAGASRAHPLLGKQEKDWFIIPHLRQSFDVRELKQEIERVPDKVDVLMIVHPKDLPEKTLFAIDQYVLAGGRALVFVDPLSEADTSMPMPESPEDGYVEAVWNSDLPRLLDAWGVRLAPEAIAADRRAATAVTTARGTTVDYVAWLTLRQDEFSSEDFVARDLQSVVMATPGHLIANPDSDTQFSPLIQTSDQAMQLEAASVKVSPGPTYFLQTYQPGGAPLVLAARISGEAKTAFPDGVEGVDTEERLTKSSQPINVIVVADTDLLDDRFWVDFQDFYGRRVATTRADNGTFIVNMLDNLSGSNDLIGLRSRGRSARPFDKVAALKEEAEQEFRSKELALQARLSETSHKIAEMQRQKEGEDALILSAEQREELKKFKTEQIKTRKELRNVQHGLTKSIEQLGIWLKVMNIGLIPTLVIIMATVLGVIRMRRMRKATMAAG